MNLDDKSLFLDAMEDVQPLKRNNDVHWHPGRNSRAPQRVDTLQLDNFLTTGYLDIVPLATPLEFKREGLQSGVLDKLRRGKYSQQASLSLLCRPSAPRFRIMAAAAPAMSRCVNRRRRSRRPGSSTPSAVVSAEAASARGRLFAAPAARARSSRGPSSGPHAPRR